MLQRLQHCGRYGVLPLRGQPLVGNRQRGFLLQVAQQPALAAGAVLLLAALPGLALGVCLQLHQGQHQVQRWGLGITLAQQGNGWRFLATGLGNVLQQWQGQGQGLRGLLGQGEQTVPRGIGGPLVVLQAGQIQPGARCRGGRLGGLGQLHRVE